MSSKTREEIFQQQMISTTDLKILIPTLGKNKCIEIIKMIQQEMIEEGKCYVVKTKPLIVPKEKLFKKLGIK